MKYDNAGHQWSRTAEESNPWLRLLSVLRRDVSRPVRRSSYVPLKSAVIESAEVLPREN